MLLIGSCPTPFGVGNRKNRIRGLRRPKEDYVHFDYLPPATILNPVGIEEKEGTRSIAPFARRKSRQGCRRSQESPRVGIAVR
jgi:hypothetical protein